jgi:tripartite-type tricarboxylate transporter receptor subunit TctC
LQEPNPPVKIGSPLKNTRFTITGMGDAMNSTQRSSLASFSFAAAAFAVAAATAVVTPAAAREYPVKPVRILAGSPGTLMDVVARQVAHRLSEKWGQPVVVENRGGAGFTIGTGVAAQAAPDGYTLVMSDRTALASAPHIYKSITYDPLRDFAPITLVAVSPVIMAAHPSLPASNLAEFVEYARSQSDAINWASSGVSTSGHIVAEMLRLQAGFNPVYVHYKGSAEAQRAILSGDPKVGFIGAPSTLALVAAGRLKAFAVTSPRRLTVAPTIPTVAESGFPGFEFEYWVGMLAPRGTPAALVARLNRDIVEIVKSSAFKEALTSQAAEPAPGTTEEFAERIRRDLAIAKKEAEMTGARAD